MPDGCYMVNCTGPGGQRRSGVAYYSNFIFGGGNDGTQPDAFIYTKFDGFTTWEGQSQAVVFADGTKFSWNIDGSAAGTPVGTRVGGAGNGFKEWSVFRDADKFMFTNGDNFNCSKIYIAA